MTVGDDAKYGSGEKYCHPEDLILIKEGHEAGYTARYTHCVYEGQVVSRVVTVTEEKQTYRWNKASDYFTDNSKIVNLYVYMCVAGGRERERERG